MSKLAVIVAALSILLLISGTYLYVVFLDIVNPQTGLKFYPIWTQNTFSLPNGDPVWQDNNFSSGWSVFWTLGQIDGSSGFDISNNTLSMYATFDAYNENSGGVSGICLWKNIGVIDTTLSPYLVIEHKETSSNSALMFSYAVLDVNQVWHDGGLYNVSASWVNSKFDLRTVYNGTIVMISIRLTNDFDPNYSGGLQYSYIRSVAIYNITWQLFQNAPINDKISTTDDILRIEALENILPDTIVSAQRIGYFSLNPAKHSFLKVDIMTSSINTAARIVIWSNPDLYKDVLVKTYNDKQWHTEIIDLNFFGFTDIYMIELSFIQVYSSNDNWVQYKQLSISNLGV
jgi:hypothetical protein